MAKLLMITGLGSAIDLASDKKGAFYNTLEEFYKHWDRIDIISPRVKSQLTGEKIIFGNTHIHISSWPLVLHPLFFLLKGTELYKKYHFDLMTVQDYPPFYNGIGARLLWSKIKVPYILEIMHIPGYPKSADIKEWFYKQYAKVFIRFIAKRASAVRVINKIEVPDFLTKYGVPKRKLRYIPAFYIDLNVFKTLNLEKKHDLIFVGRLEKNKGLDILLEIAHKSDLKILIVGSGPLMGYIDDTIQNHKLVNVKRFGFAKDSTEIAELINESRALIMPSYNEGGPRVILEALACGVPVIATRVGIVSDVINQSNGRIINWSADEAINAFSEIKNIKPAENLIQFERVSAIKNYADELKTLIGNA
jgi:glycosyltransferase involved in cell wall biosynthesis